MESGTTRSKTANPSKEHPPRCNPYPPGRRSAGEAPDEEPPPTVTSTLEAGPRANRLLPTDARAKESMHTGKIDLLLACGQWGPPKEALERNNPAPTR